MASARAGATRHRLIPVFSNEPNAVCLLDGQRQDKALQAMNKLLHLSARGIAEPSQRVIERKWASGFLFGLAMPGAEEYAGC